MDGVSDSNGLYFLLMIYRGCCLSHGKHRNYLFEHGSHRSHRFIKCHTESTESTENLIAMRIVRIERIYGVACGEKSYIFSPNLTELLFNGPAEIAEIAESRVTGIGICPKNENTILIPLSSHPWCPQLSDMLFLHYHISCKTKRHKYLHSLSSSITNKNDISMEDVIIAID